MVSSQKDPKAVVAIGIKPGMGDDPDAENNSDYDDTGEPEFAAPPGYEPPADSKPGEEIPVLAKIRQKPDGTYCLVSIDGAAFAGSDQPEEKDDRGMELDQDTPVDDNTPPPPDEGASLSQRIAAVRTKMKR